MKIELRQEERQSELEAHADRWHEWLKTDPQRQFFWLPPKGAGAQIDEPTARQLLEKLAGPGRSTYLIVANKRIVGHFSVYDYEEETKHLSIYIAPSDRRNLIALAAQSLFNRTVLPKYRSLVIQVLKNNYPAKGLIDELGLRPVRDSRTPENCIRYLLQNK